MNIHPANASHLDAIMALYDTGRAFMRAHGNHAQWINGYPSKEMLTEDIEKGHLFICEQNGHLCGVFAFILGEDSTYLRIEDGEWPNHEPYGTIHRIASDGSCKGVLSSAVHFALQHCNHLRADTHAANTVMQSALTKLNFKYCGVIYVDNGSPRLAYHLTKKAAE